MGYEGYETLSVSVAEGVAYLTIDHPPVNLFDLALIGEMTKVGEELAADGAVRVVVIQSANPDFFIAHADVGLIMLLPTEVGPAPTEHGLFHAMVERFRTMPKVTIGKIEGRARGGGSELLLGLDMRFAALGKAVLSQPEVTAGIIPGGGGTQRLPRLIGRGRALEVILGCLDYPADLAERYGYVNRALPPEQLGPFVDALAKRIAAMSPEAVAAAKQAVALTEVGLREGLLQEEHLFNQRAAAPEARALMQGFLEAGGQTHAFETDFMDAAGKIDV